MPNHKVCCRTCGTEQHGHTYSPLRFNCWKCGAVNHWSQDAAAKGYKWALRFGQRRAKRRVGARIALAEHPDDLPRIERRESHW